MKRVLELCLPALLSTALSVGLVLWLDHRRGPVAPAPVPAPVTSLEAALRAAYAADPSPTKGADLEFYTEVCRQAADTAQDPDVKNAKVLVEDVLHKVAQKELGDRLKGVRTAVATYLNNAMQTKTSAELDGPLRARYAAEFTTIAQALEGVQ